MMDITSSNYIMHLVGIMILSGAFGGMTSAFLRKSDDQPFLMVFFTHIFIGIATAMMVPLILNVFSSDLLDSGQTKPHKLFTLSGLCIFFALFSARFLESIFSDRKSKSEQHSPQVQQGMDKGQKKQEVRTTAAPAEVSEKTKLSENQLKILKALVEAEEGRLSLADLMKASAMSQREFDESLAMLIVRGLVAQELIEGAKLQLVLTARGEQLLRKMTQ